jgi:hypothetical protein
MSEWVYFLHPPREDFAATGTDEEEAVWAVHFERLKDLLARGTVVLAGPTLGPPTRASLSSRRPMRSRREGSWMRTR